MVGMNVTSQGDFLTLSLAVCWQTARADCNLFGSGKCNCRHLSLNIKACFTFEVFLCFVVTNLS